MYIKRDLEPSVLNYATKFPVVAVVGPRQAGKTTLARAVFPHHKYFLLEDPGTLDMVRADPRGFLERDYGTPGIILDEFQNEPQLLSYMQGIVDNNRRPGYFILTGSHNFLKNQAITQSLAGRVALLTLLPFSLKELDASGRPAASLDEALVNGAYPHVIEQAALPSEFYPQYIKTYVERDVRQLLNVVNLSDFQRFIRLCAARIGQLLNISSLADDCNISVPTVKAWLSILEASYILFLVQPHFKNFNKRLTKSSKLYFYDMGLACWLLKIDSSEQVHDHYLRGNLVESLVIGELYKQFYNQGQEPSIYFWRDNHGHEIDCLLDYGTRLIPIEIKSGTTVSQRFFEGLCYWNKLAQADPVYAKASNLDSASSDSSANGYVIYGGLEEQVRPAGTVISWRKTVDLIKK